MAAKTIQEIKEVIENKVKGIEYESDPLFTYVTTSPGPKFEGYPAAVIRTTGFEGERIDTHRIERIFSFEIGLFQEYGPQTTGSEEASDRLELITDLVIEAFDKDNDLGDEVEVVDVASGTFDFAVRPGLLMFASLSIRCRVIVDGFE